MLWVFASESKNGYRRKGIGSFLLRGIPKDRLKAIVVDTPLINKQAITFYEQSGFVKVL
jgi:ribosomal protein S18 acetylase RimI-like enzyme